MRLALLPFLLTACFEQDAPAPAPSPGEAPAATPATAPAAQPPATPPAVGQRPQATEAAAGELAYAGEAEHAAMSEHWLVIVASDPAGTAPSPAIAGLAEDPTLGVKRLWSNRFKNLSPCYGVAVAGSFADVKEARARSAELKAKGVDHYLKNAGQYVGVDSRLDRLCAQPDTSTCADQTAIAVTVGGTPHLGLHLEQELVDRAVANSPAPTSLAADGSEWSAPLAVKQVGAVKKGDAWTLWGPDGAAPLSCTVEGFAAVTRGTPHFGWVQDADRHASPGCGSPEPMARLSCEGAEAEGPWVARPAAAPALASYERGADLEDVTNGSFMSAIRGHASADFEEGEAWAKDQGTGLVVDSSIHHWSAGDVTLTTVSARIFTGEGFNECGGEDFDRTVFGVYPPDGVDTQQKVQVFETSDSTVLGLYDSEAGLQLLVADWFGDLRLIGADGEATCTLDHPYCDCPC